MIFGHLYHYFQWTWKTKRNLLCAMLATINRATRLDRCDKKIGIYEKMCDKQVLKEKVMEVAFQYYIWICFDQKERNLSSFNNCYHISDNKFVL